MKPVFLHQMSWIEAKEILAVAKVVVVVTGAIEQHGPHLPLNLDTESAYFVATRAAERVYPKAIVCAPTPIGFSPFNLSFPGTLTLRSSTFNSIMFDVAASFSKHGVSNIFFLNGHGGNSASLFLITRKIRDKLSMNAMWMNYWDLIPRELCEKTLGTESFPDHAGKFETSIGLFVHPELVNMKNLEIGEDEENNQNLDAARKFASHNRMQKSGVLFAINNATMQLADVSPSGISPGGGNPATAESQIGEQLVRAAVDELSALIQEMP